LWGRKLVGFVETFTLNVNEEVTNLLANHDLVTAMPNLEGKMQETVHSQEFASIESMVF